MATKWIKIAVAIDVNGDWEAVGSMWRDESDAMEEAVRAVMPGANRYWIEAQIEIPEIPVVRANVTKSEES